MTQSDRSSPNALSTAITYPTIGEARSCNQAIPMLPYFLSTLTERVDEHPLTVPRSPKRSRVGPGERAPETARSIGAALVQGIRYDD